MRLSNASWQKEPGYADSIFFLGGGALCNREVLSKVYWEGNEHGILFCVWQTGAVI